MSIRAPSVRRRRACAPTARRRSPRRRRPHPGLGPGWSAACCSSVSSSIVKANQNVCDPFLQRARRPYNCGLLRHLRVGRRLRDCVGIVVDKNVRSDLDGVLPLRRRPQRHARDAVPVRLLLQAARVGEDRACEASAAKSRYPSGWIIRTCPSDSPSDVATQPRGCAGKTRSSIRLMPSKIRASRSGCTLASRWTVATA